MEQNGLYSVFDNLLLETHDFTDNITIDEAQKRSAEPYQEATLLLLIKIALTSSEYYINDRAHRERSLKLLKKTNVWHTILSMMAMHGKYAQSFLD